MDSVPQLQQLKAWESSAVAEFIGKSLLKFLVIRKELRVGREKWKILPFLEVRLSDAIECLSRAESIPGYTITRFASDYQMNQ